MGFIKTYRDFLESVKDNQPDITTLKMVDDGTDINKYLSELTSFEESIMLGVIPVSGNNSPADADSYQNRYFCEVVIGNKLTASGLDQETFVDTFDKNHTLALAFQKLLLDAATSGECALMAQLEANSIQITTFRISQFIGWTVIFFFNRAI